MSLFSRLISYLYFGEKQGDRFFVLVVYLTKCIIRLISVFDFLAVEKSTSEKTKLSWYDKRH